jgi:hypothetical protein
MERMSQLFLSVRDATPAGECVARSAVAIPPSACTGRDGCRREPHDIDCAPTRE